MSENNNDEVLDELLDEIGDTDDEELKEAAQLLKEAAADTDTETPNLTDDSADSEEEQDSEPVIFADEEENEEEEEEDYSEEPEFPEERPVRRAPARRNPPQRKKKKKKKKHSRLPGILILTTFVITASICLSLVIIAFGKDILGIGKDDTTHLLILQEGVSTDEIAIMLKDEGIISSPECFKLFSRLRKTDDLYLAGEHFVRPNMAYETIIDELTSVHEDEKVPVQVTFNEGWNLYQIANELEKQGVCNANDFVFYFNSGDYGFSFEQRLPTDTTLKLNRMEGYAFPDTYFFYKDMDPIQVCQKIYLNFDSKLSEDRIKKMEELGLTLDELITLASIVQAEAPDSDTMIMVASVFWNRLRNSDVFPKLESDPTTNYSTDIVARHLEVYDKNMIEAYDTYQSAGLPPGAIGNPGLEAIDAVLKDFKSNYYYFIANIYTKRTEFSETYEEHLVHQEEIEEEERQYVASSQAAELEAAAQEENANAE